MPSRVIPPGRLSSASRMTPRRPKIGRLPEAKIARLVDDLRPAPRLASTAISAPRRRKAEMNQPDSEQYPAGVRAHGGSRPANSAAIGRLAALGGLGFLVASFAGDLVIGAFPGPDTPVSQLVSFYTAHHAQVGRRDTAGPVRRLLRPVRHGRLGADPAGGRQSAACRPGPDRHRPGRRHHAGQRGNLRRARRHRRPARHRPGCPAGLAHHGLRRLAGRQRQHIPVPDRGRGGGHLRHSHAAVARLACARAGHPPAPARPGFLASLVFLAWAAAAGISMLFARRPRRLSQARQQSLARSATGSAAT